MIFHELPPAPPGLSKRQQRKWRVAMLLECRLIADADRRGPSDRVRRIPRHARWDPYARRGAACPVKWGELREIVIGTKLGALLQVLTTPPVVDALDSGFGDMNRAIAESRGDPWPPVHRKPLQHAPGCCDASCTGCR